MFRQIFDRIVRQCMDAGLVKGAGFAVDASVIEADASRFQRVEGSEIDWSEDQRASRAVREYLIALESENAPTNPERKPKALSPSDPSAAWTSRGRNKVMFGYSLNDLIDMENAVIVDVEATPTRISKEVEATEIMIERPYYNSARCMSPHGRATGAAHQCLVKNIAELRTRQFQTSA